jgi:hypothetical protein
MDNALHIGNNDAWYERSVPLERLGGKNKAKKSSEEERSEIARKAAHARG